MSADTPARLAVRDRKICGEGGSVIEYTLIDEATQVRIAAVHELGDQGRRIAERLRATWNACTSIKTERIQQIAETGGFVHERSLELNTELNLAADRDELVKALRKEAALLRHWAVQSRSGGWSTHQVEPMRQRANELDDLLAKYPQNVEAKEPTT